MRKNEMQQEFPQMPEEMRAMIREKVAQQLQADAEYAEKDIRSAGSFKTRKGKRRRLAVAVLAASMTIGVTSLAGTGLYRMYQERLGNYAVKTTVEPGNSTEDQSAAVEIQATGTQAADGQITSYKNPVLRAGYVPEGMTEAPGGMQWYYEDNPNVGGISGILYRLEDGDKFEIVDKYILDTEEIDVNGHEGYYLTRQVVKTGPSVFDRIVYVLYPEANLVCHLDVAGNVSREEVLKLVQGFELEEADEAAVAERKIPWSQYLKSLLPEPVDSDMQLHASYDEMSQVHQIGEAFPLMDMRVSDENGASVDTKDITAEVASVQILDDLSTLNPDYIDGDLQEQTDESGKLKKNELTYVRLNDGVDAGRETVWSEEVPQKLVLAEVKYTNTGDQPLYNVLFLANLMKLEETGDGYDILDRTKKGPEPSDEVYSGGLGSVPEMLYFDVTGSGNNNGTNYIDCIQPGETATVHIGFISNEDELGNMYLNLDPTGGGLQFSEGALQTGFVDIRQ